MAEWPTKPLSAFVDPSRSICYGIVQPGSNDPNGKPVLRVNNFKNGRIDIADHMRVSPDIETKYSRSRLRGGELLVTLVGTMGLSAIVPDDLAGWNIARAVGLIPLRDDVDTRWINFVVRSRPAQEFIQIRANTTVQATFNLKDLAELPVPMPPEDFRKAASELLSVLDDKIELNWQTNETLEAMARAIFKDWFVDFGPTQAKMEGREPYLASEFWALFPDRIDDETGLPEGWSLSEIGEYIEILDSKRIPLSSKQRAERKGPYPYHGATGAMDYIDDYLFDETLLLLGEDGSVVKEDGRPFTQYVWGKIWVNNHAHVLRGSGLSVEQLKCFFDQVNISAYVTGAVQLKLNQANMKRIPFTRASDELHQAFDLVAHDLFALIRANTDETWNLTKTRDLLLPRLMSGEIRLRDAEKIVGEAL